MFNIFNKTIYITCEIIYKSDSTKECINDNWVIRKNYWIPYHFRSYNLNYKQIDNYRLSVGIILLGPGMGFLLLFFFSIS